MLEKISLAGIARALQTSKLWLQQYVNSIVYVTAQYPPKFIRAMLSLTDEQVNAALYYIEAHRAEVEAEYQTVLQEAEKLRQYWEEQNRELFAQIAAKPPKPGTEAIRAKLQAAKAKIESKV